MFNPHSAWRDSTPWTSLFSQIVLMAIASVLYFAVRALTQDQAALAFANAEAIVRLEEALGLDLESAAQSLILDSSWLVTFFNWVYMWLHWPLLLATLFYSFFRARFEYVLFRDAVIVSGLIGLFFFAFYPVAPPRLFDTSLFFDSVAELSNSYKYLQPKNVVNQFAALPSFHVGWNILAGFTIFRTAKHWPIKAFAIASPILMMMSVVLTANHWVIDVFAGSAIAFTALGTAWLLRRRATSSATSSGRLASTSGSR